MELTKKVIESQSRFILLIVRKKQFTKPCEPFVVKLKASGIIEAMIEAENYIDDTVYLVNIAEKTDEITEGQMLIYNEILKNKGNGWYDCNSKHYEQPYKHGYSVEFDFFVNLGQIK